MDNFRIHNRHLTVCLLGGNHTKFGAIASRRQLFARDVRQECETAAAGLRTTGNLEVKVRALLAERRQRIGYEKQLEAAVSACE